MIVALSDYESLKETAYLLRSPENARRLLALLAELALLALLARRLLAAVAVLIFAQLLIVPLVSHGELLPHCGPA